MELLIKLTSADVNKQGAFGALEELCRCFKPEEASYVNVHPPKPKKEAPTPEQEPEPEQEQTPETATETEAADYTVEEVRRAFGDLSRAKGKEAAKGILAEMGYTKVTEIPYDKYAYAMERIREVS